MIGAIIYDNWGLAFGFVFVLVALTSSAAILAKIVLVAIGTLIIVMGFTKNYFVFYSVPEEKPNKENK